MNHVTAAKDWYGGPKFHDPCPFAVPTNPCPGQTKRHPTGRNRLWALAVAMAASQGEEGGGGAVTGADGNVVGGGGGGGGGGAAVVVVVAATVVVTGTVDVVVDVDGVGAGAAGGERGG